MGWKNNKDPNMSRIELLPVKTVRTKNYRTNGSDPITVSRHCYGDKLVYQILQHKQENAILYLKV